MGKNQYEHHTSSVSKSLGKTLRLQARDPVSNSSTHGHYAIRKQNLWLLLVASKHKPGRPYMHHNKPHNRLNYPMKSRREL